MRRHCLGEKEKVIAQEQERDRKMKEVNGSGDVTVCQRSHVPNSMIVDAVLCGCQNQNQNVTGST